MEPSIAYQRTEMPSRTSGVLEARTLENANANLLAVLKEGQTVVVTHARFAKK